ncbi:hypothetical protein ACET8B_02065 [Aeromonas caviae]|uniref:hypothetical protein n=1 Tax=Aeromonas caviae TaxID=648 RepID=UPI0038D0028A
MRICIVMVLMLHSIMFASAVSAVMYERPVPVSVSIVTNKDSSALEIETDNDAFQAIYDVAMKGFFPLTIPFKVRSVSGQNVNYDLFVSQLAGQCGDKSPLALTTELDGTVIQLNEKRRAAGVDNDHLIVISFPSIPQSDIEQHCDGSMSLVAELVI